MHMGTSIGNEIKNLFVNAKMRYTLAALFSITLLQYFLGNILHVTPGENYYAAEFFTYYFLKNNLFYAVLILGVIVSYFVLLRSKYTFPKVSKGAYIILICCILLLVWSFAGYEFNHYYSKWHLLDRLLLVGLGGLAIMRPFFVVLFVFQAYLIANQFDAPAYFKYTFTDKDIIFDVLLVFWLYYCVKILMKSLQWHFFMLLALVIICNWYLRAGISKFVLGWLWENNLYNLSMAAYELGWFSFFEKDTIARMFRVVDEHHVLLQAITLSIEIVAPLLVILNRKLTIVVLFSFILFHLGVFLSSGVFFWKWIVFEIVLIGIIWKARECRQLFGVQNFIVYLLLLIFGGGFYSSLGLAWFDSGYLTTYSFFLEDVDGDVQRLDSSFFAPYDTNFAQGRFFFLAGDNKVLSSTCGTVVNKDLYLSLRSSDHSLSHITELKENYGRSSYDSIKGVNFKNFLLKFTTSKNTSLPKPHGIWNPPLHIYLGESQINLRIPSAKNLLIVSEEKQIARPDEGVDFLTDYKVYRSDTLSIKLKE